MASWIVGHMRGTTVCLFLGFLDCHSDNHENYLNSLIFTRLLVFSERELMFMFAICRRPSVCLSVCRLSVCNVRAPYSAD